MDIEKLTKKIKTYDRFLEVKKNLNGSISIFRKSPFYKKTHDIFTVSNRFIGSGNWLIKKMSEMDTQRNNIISQVVNNNKKKLYDKKDNELHREMADLMLVDRISLS